MPIIFKCQCGQYFTSANSLVGYKFDCVRCHIQVTVPNPHFEEKKQQDILDVLFPDESQSEQKKSVLFEKSDRCQHCGAKMVSGQHVCGLCGLQSG